MMSIESADTTTREPRNYGIDLLRIVAMYMICMHHALVHGALLENAAPFVLPHRIASFFNIAAYCAVDCFALISGYVGVKAIFKCRSLFRLWAQVLFYSFGISLIFYFAKPGTVSSHALLMSCFPVSTEAYWYFSAYALMFFGIPQMNFILVNQNKVAIKKFLWTFFLLFSLCSIVPYVNGITDSLRGGYSAIWLGYLYFIGGFLRLYGISELFQFPDGSKWGNRLAQKIQTAFLKPSSSFAVFALFVFFTFILFLLGPFARKIFSIRPVYWEPLFNYNSPLTLIASVSLLECFANIQCSKRWLPIIRFASPLTFGVYLIHDNEVIRMHLISCMFTECPKLPPCILPLAIIVIPLGIYILCSLIDYVRLQFFECVKKLVTH